MAANFNFEGAKLTPEGKKFMAEINKLIESTIHVGFCHITQTVYLNTVISHFITPYLNYTNRCLNSGS